MKKLVLWFVYVMCIMIAHNYGEVYFHCVLFSVIFLLMHHELRFKIGGITTTDLFTLVCYFLFYFYFTNIYIVSFCLFAIIYQMYNIIKRI